MPDHLDRIQFVADRGDARLRLDQVLVRRVSEVSRLSRSVAQRWIESGAVTVNRAPAARPSTRVPEGATVEVTLPASATRRVRPGPEQGTLDILYEDADVLVLNKPAGVVVHPSYKQSAGTLLNTVLWRLRDHPDARPGILTRLDKDTSGAVVVVLTPGIHAVMQRDAAAGLFRKEYLAVVTTAPVPPAGTISVPLARDPGDRRRMVATPGGAAAETRYELIATDPRPLVRCDLITGRTHQIRVHLATSGWPIAGDGLYGRPDEAIARQALHAWRVTFPHPTTRIPIVIEAPIPADLASLIAPHPLEAGLHENSQRRASGKE